MQIVRGVEELTALAGSELGETGAVVVSQATIDQFAEATGDHQWIHVSPERAASGPFGTTIAHGYLTLSLVPVLLKQLLTIEGFSHGLNYGLNKVRFPSPLPAGSAVKATARVLDVTAIEKGVQPTFLVVVRAVGADKPACVAEVVYRYLV